MKNFLLLFLLSADLLIPAILADELPDKAICRAPAQLYDRSLKKVTMVLPEGTRVEKIKKKKQV